jgi:hypothetical protein
LLHPQILSLEAVPFKGGRSKFGVNVTRSRGDRDEVFGGLGASWRGAFVGGDLLVDAITDGERPIYGNFKGGSRFPEGLDL